MGIRNNLKVQRTPDFLIVGAAKSGTTSLVNYLAAHPGIEVVSSRLEHFGEYGNPAEGNLDREAYLKHFENIPSSIVAGEKSVSYLYSRQAIQEIYEMNPRMKIIMVLRDPTERAYSDYWHRRRTAVEHASFEQALQQEESRMAEGARFELHYANYGRYFRNVSAYLEKFGSDNVLAVRYEDLRNDPEAVCKECFRFLHVATDFKLKRYPIYNKGTRGRNNILLRTLFWMSQQARIVTIVRRVFRGNFRRKITRWMEKSNGVDEYPEIDKETEASLRAFFQDDVKGLEGLLGWDLSNWKP